MSRVARWLFGLTAGAAALFVHLLPAPDRPGGADGGERGGQGTVRARVTAEGPRLEAGAGAAGVEAPPPSSTGADPAPTPIPAVPIQATRQPLSASAADHR